jgi:transcriptional regulator with XRE-family HTH domain
VSVAKQFGDNLKRQRKLADQSQEETAVRAGSTAQRSAIWSGLRIARADTIAKLAAALEVDPGELFEGIDWQPGDIRRGQFKPDQDATL